MVSKVLGHSTWQMMGKFKTWLAAKVSSRALPGENGSQRGSCRCDCQTFVKTPEKSKVAP